ncbi:CBU_0592 family membrane protein [Pseudarthrobacter sp. H2]|uniref:CBU_0592 family membrane protein n=1 Tax=Pseudarthrobacter sp. H2 TaxID=3418415 RepID=UPI003CE698DD
MEPLWEIAGWAGAAAILSAYLAVSMGWLKAGRGFQTANLLGACAFIVNGAFHEAWPSVATNIAWFLISAIALIRMRAASPPRAPVVDAPQVQFPGVPDTTAQLAVVEVLTGSVHGDVDGQGSSHSCPDVSGSA